MVSACSRSLRHNESIAGIIRVEPQQVAITAVPFTGFEVLLKLLQSRFDVSDRPERRTPRPDARVEIRPWPAPIGVQESIVAIVGHEDRGNLHGPQSPRVVGYRRHLRVIQS